MTGQYLISNQYRSHVRAQTHKQNRKLPWTEIEVNPTRRASESRSTRLMLCFLNFSGEKPFECKLCHQRSRDYSAMIKHLRTHNGASPYQCTICQDFCPSLAAMQKHMKGHKPEDVPADWRIEKTYLYVCYVWAGLGPHAESNTYALSMLGENHTTPASPDFSCWKMACFFMGLKKFILFLDKLKMLCGKLSFWEFFPCVYTQH